MELEEIREGATWLSAGEEHLCHLKGPQDKQVKGRDRLVVNEARVKRVMEQSLIISENGTA